ncbi:MAG TPA: nuclear transport factor 2 family protein [Terracidiphilus sp.]|nr:nuclear transport factor 2 family protein [Terracidiphilus sp.]
MNRLSVCFAAFLFAVCVATAQTPAPDPATTTATAGQSGTMTTESPEIVEFQKIEDAWSAAVNQHDQYGLENVLSPLFVDVAANGDITTRNQQVVQVISTDDKGLFLSQKVIAVRMLGDVAVANGTYLWRHRVGSQEVTEKGVFTHVYERVRGGWRCINSQRTVLREDRNGKQKKPSTAEEPFHIPFFSRGDKDSHD